MRIAVTSDLHLDLVPRDRLRLVVDALAEEIRRVEPDVFVIAGDIANHHSIVGSALSKLALAPHNLFVPGNHDIWLSRADIAAGITSADALTSVEEAATSSGFVPLTRRPVEIDGWLYAGTVGWYDYTFRVPELGIGFDGYAEKSLHGIEYQDRTRVRWESPTTTDPEVAGQMLDGLRNQLNEAGLREWEAGAPTIVVSHHLPYRELVTYRGFPEWDYFSAFMGAEGFGSLLDSYPAVRAVLAGHTHEPRALTTTSGRLAVVSPLGYYGSLEYPRDLRDRVAILETEDSSVRLVRAPRNRKEA
jgi:putative phosphoesterase